MDEELNVALMQFIQLITTAAERAGQFGVEQMPEVIEQLLLWNLTRSLILFLLGVAIIIAAIVGGVRFFLTDAEQKAEIEAAKKAYADGENWTRWREGTIATSTKYDRILSGEYHLEHNLTVILVSCAGIAFGMTLVLFNVAWIQILIAPKVWLIEYAANLLK